MASSKSFLVIGIGRFGSSLAKTLCKLGHEVLAVDQCEERVNEISEFVTHAVQLDTTDERAISQLGVRNFDAVVVSVGDDLRSSILATVICKEQGAQKLICKASDELHAKLLQKTGADVAIMPERDSGVRLAHSLTSENLLDFLELSAEYSINEILIPAAWANRSLMDINVRAKYKISIVAVKRGGEITLALSADDMLRAGDKLVVVGANKDLAKVAALPV